MKSPSTVLLLTSPPMLSAPSRFASVLVTLCSVSLPASGQANYDSALIGGRSSLLGGTGVVEGTDAAAPLQNPATIVQVEGTSLVFSTFFFELSGRTLQVDPQLIEEVERGENELQESKLRVLPTSTCLFFDAVKRPRGERGAHKFSVCFSEPEEESFSLNSRVLARTTEEATGFQNRFITQSYRKEAYALGWATTLGRGLSFGITPMLEHVSHEDSEGIVSLVADAASPDAVVGSPAEKSTNVAVRSASAFAVSAIFGLRYQASPRFSSGISLQTPSLHLAGSYQSTRSGQQALGPNEDYQQELGSARFTYPFRLAMGIAGRIRRVRFELNGYIHGGRSDFAEITTNRQRVRLKDGVVTGVDEDEVTFRERTRPTLNVGAGVEIPLIPSWDLLFGALTDFSGLPPRQANSPADEVLFRQHMDSIHASVGVQWSPRVGTLLLGTRFFYGEGEIGISDPTAPNPTLIAPKQSAWGLSLVVSGQLSLQMLALADPTGILEKATESDEAP